MLTWIPSLLKIFLEKYFITTIASVLGTIVAMAFTPDGYWLLQKLGAWYYIGIFCFAFLFIHGCYCGIKFTVQKISENQQKKQEEEKLLEQTMTAFDHCSQKQRDIAYALLKNKNTPVVIHEQPYIHGCNWTWMTGIDFFRQKDGTYQVILRDYFYKRLQRIYTQHGRLSHFDFENNSTKENF